jgi:hypothetical protein
MKKWGKNLIIICISIAITMLILEVVLRLTDFGRNKLIINKNYSFYDYYKGEAEMGYDIKENIKKRTYCFFGYCFDLWSNEIGCFDNPYRGEKDYILLTGDSFTFGYVPFSDNWGAIIENILNLRVLKSGVVGFGTKQELIKTKKLMLKLPYPPKIIIVGYFLNDLEDDYTFPNKTVEDGYLVVKKFINGKKGAVIEKSAKEIKNEVTQYIKTGCPYPYWQNKISWWLKKRSILFNIIIEPLRSIFFLGGDTRLNNMLSFQPINDDWIKMAWQQHLNNLLLFKQLTDNINSKLLVIIIPCKEQVYRFLSKKEYVNIYQPNQILVQFFKKNNIMHLDLLPLFISYADQKEKKLLDSEKDLYWRYDDHWNVRGNHLAGLLSSEYLLDNNLIVIPNGDKKLPIIKQELEKLLMK